MRMIFEYCVLFILPVISIIFDGCVVCRLNRILEILEDKSKKDGQN